LSRRARLPRPIRKDEWLIEAVNDRVAKEWCKLAAVAPNELAAACDQLSTDPIKYSNRQHRLRGDLATGTYEGTVYDRWQYEVTAGGRVWYFVDDPTQGGGVKPVRKGRGGRPRRRVLIEKVHIGHPKATE